MPRSVPRCSVILSTYNSPRALGLSLEGWAHQEVAPDEILVADDGSGEETRAVVESFKARLPLLHVWQEDDGFRKSRVLNAAIRAAQHPYLVFSDGDCVPRRDFLRGHLEFAREGQWVSGASQVNIPPEVHARFGAEDVAAGRVFDVRWLQESSDGKWTPTPSRFRPAGGWTRVLDRLTAQRAKFVGNNAGCWRDDLIAVNGFDESFGYGAEDRDVGARLQALGKRCDCHKYSLLAIHLGHTRCYVHKELVARQKEIVAERLKNRVAWTETGLERGPKRG